MRSAPFLLLALLGCQPASPPVLPEEQPPAAVPAPPAAAGQEAPAAVQPPGGEALAGPQALIGEYRLAGVDGTNIDLPHGITARIGGDAIHVDSGCVRFAWSYAFEGADITTKPLDAGGCERALLPEERAIEAAFGNASRVVRTPANGVEFSGGGYSVLLFSQ